MTSQVFVNGVTLSDGAGWAQDVDNVVYQFLSGVAGTNTITAIGPAGLGAYAAGRKFRFIPAATNTGATTINITGTAALGARNIFSGGVALTGGELAIGIPVEIVDDGTRFHLTSGTAIGRVAARRKISDESVISSTTLQDDDHLFFPIGASEEWIADCSVSCGGNISSTGVKVAITAPAGATLEFDFYFIGDIGAIRTGGGRTTTSGTAVSFASASFAGCSDAELYLNMWVLNSTTPGNVTVQWAQGTNAAFNTTFRKGSHLLATRVA